jgi:hypothetical protein
MAKLIGLPRKPDSPVGTVNPAVQGAGTVTNQELVQPHKVDFYSCRGIREAAQLRFRLRTAVVSNAQFFRNNKVWSWDYIFGAVQVQFF